MIDLADRRRCYAEEIEAVANLRTPALVEALATVPREAFLRPGPWTILGEGGLGAPRPTPDADPRRVYHNVAVAIEPARQLFNGAPTVVSMAIDALGLAPGARVMHLGCGLGYYTALIARCVGPTGRVLALEVDEALAGEARANLASLPWTEVRHGNGTEPLGETFDAMLVNAGVTHARDAWLDALSPTGRLVLPLTATLPQMGTIGKGLLLLLSHAADGSFDTRILTAVAIYSALGLRDDGLNEALGKVLSRGLMAPLKRLRRDAHEPSPGCWVHGATSCLTT
jgi:protein-L-isoaspartate(D-aspartate) O-methyltransferase